MIHLGRMKQWMAGALAMTMIFSTGISAYAGTGADVSAAPIEENVTAENPYEFSVEASVEEHKVTLSWKAVEGIEYYRVFDKDGKELSEEKIVPATDLEGVLQEEALTFEIADVRCVETPYVYVVKGYQLEVTEEGAEPAEKVLYEAEASVKVGVELETPVLSSAKFTKENQVTVSWNAVNGASEYNVYRKVAGGEWTYLTTVKETSYIDGDVTLGDVYYTVQAAAECCEQTSAYDEAGMKAFYVKAAEITAVKSPDSGHVKVTWNKVEGAKGYRVQMRIGNGAWKDVTTTTKTSYVHSFSKSYWGKQIYFYVYAYCDEYTAPVSDRRSTVFSPEKAELVSAKAIDYNSVKLTWKKMPGVAGYKVYRKAAGSNTWKLLKTITGEDKTTYTSNSAVTGTTYSYTVKTYWKSGTKTRLGYYDKTGLEVKTTLEVPKLVSAKTTGTKIQVKWEPVPGATGYAIYRKAPEEKSWTRITRVSGNTTSSYKDDAPKANVKYNYRVKSYIKRDGKFTYSLSDGKGLDVVSKVGVQLYKVKDKKSALYGKTLKLHYDKNGKKIENIHSMVGKKSNYYIYVNKTKQYVTAYYKENGYYVPVRSMICSTGEVLSHTPNGTFKTKAKYRWKVLSGPSWGQYSTRIVGSILFHSIFYQAKNDPLVITRSAYNDLGTPASHGCVRLTCESAKWIYDNCKLGTTVYIYQKSGYEPFKKPTAYKLKKGHTWDPTDTKVNWRCKEQKCHDYAE